MEDRFGGPFLLAMLRAYFRSLSTLLTNRVNETVVVARGFPSSMKITENP